MRLFLTISDISFLPLNLAPLFVPVEMLDPAPVMTISHPKENPIDIICPEEEPAILCPVGRPDIFRSVVEPNSIVYPVERPIIFSPIEESIVFSPMEEPVTIVCPVEKPCFIEESLSSVVDRIDAVGAGSHSLGGILSHSTGAIPTGFALDVSTVAGDINKPDSGCAVSEQFMTITITIGENNVINFHHIEQSIDSSANLNDQLQVNELTVFQESVAPVVEFASIVESEFVWGV